MKVAAATLLLCLSGASAFAPVHQSSHDSLVRLEMADRRQVLQQSALIAAASLLSTATPALAEPRPTYLTEPTEEFKENERKAMEFRRQQLAMKQKFTAVLDRLGTETTEDQLVADLTELRTLTIETAGLPLGIKKDDLIKIVRAKKAKGFWPTNVEIAYQSLIGEIRFQQSPNTEKDMGNPL